MDYIANRESQIAEMLKVIGIESIQELFASIPDGIRLPALTTDDGLSEGEGLAWMERLADKNTFGHYESYLGAGAYEHYVPALVSAITSKSEFLTAYTPYQAEVSQGMLQAIFEFQSAICALTGLDAANASLYDGASACAEAVLMSLRLKPERQKILIARSLHPHYRAVVNTVVCSHAVQIVECPFLEDGSLDLAFALSQIDASTACMLWQTPNVLGVIEQVQKLSEAARNAGALTIVCANPMSYGLFASAKELGADIAVGDGQPFGLPLQFGGPYVGYISCAQEYVRQLPGRIVGETLDKEGKRGFVLTLQAREQHIRREKATSNVCTNQALAALACLVGLLWYGPQGVRELALTNYQRAQYLKEGLRKIPGMRIHTVPTFHEFAAAFPCSLSHVVQTFREQHIEPGLVLNRFYPEMKDALLIAVTETKNQAQLDRYLDIARQLCRGCA